MKISELISILERVQEHFDDCDIEVSIPNKELTPGQGYNEFNHLLALSGVSFNVGGVVSLRAGKKPNPEVNQ